MDLRGGFVLGSRLAAALGRIVLDRVDEAVGAALPRSAEQLANTEVVNRLLAEHAPWAAMALPPVRSVRLPGVDFESSNCRNFLIELDFDSDARSDSDCRAGAERAQELPKSAYVKLPCAEIGTRLFANAVGFWEVEVAFCERVAARVPIRVPRVYAVARRGARFVLLLENLQELPGTRMFINRDMAAGTTTERARMCLDTFAELHAPFWGWSEEKRDALIPAHLHTYRAPGGADLTRALNAASIERAHDAAPDLFEAHHVETFRRAIEKWDALIDYWYSGPLTLIHGDSHLANCFEYASEDGPRMGMIDFQGMHWCRGIRDVQYFLINSLAPDLLAAHETELIDSYRSALEKRGILLDATEAFEQYRAFSFQTAMVAVTSIGLGGLTESEPTVRTVLGRSMAAIERLGFRDWLEAL